MAVNLVASSCFVGTLIWAAAADLLTFQIRNRLVLILLASYAMLVPFSGISATDIGWNVTIAAGVLMGMFLLFAFGWIGGGDAKLTAVIALWLGADQALAFVLCTALFGGVLTMILIKFRLALLPAHCLTVPWIARLHAPETGVPYGVAIAGAGLFLFSETPWMNALT